MLIINNGCNSWDPLQYTILLNTNIIDDLRFSHNLRRDTTLLAIVTMAFLTVSGGFHVRNNLFATHSYIWKSNQHDAQDFCFPLVQCCSFPRLSFWICAPLQIFKSFNHPCWKLKSFFNVKHSGVLGVAMHTLLEGSGEYSYVPSSFETSRSYSFLLVSSSSFLL